MLAALLFHSPFFAALMFVVSGLLIGYALGIGRETGSEWLRTIVTSLRKQNHELRTSLRQHIDINEQLINRQHDGQDGSQSKLQELHKLLEQTLAEHRHEHHGIDEGLTAFRQLTESTLQDLHTERLRREELQRRLAAITQQKAELDTKLSDALQRQEFAQHDQSQTVIVAEESTALQTRIEELQQELANVREALCVTEQERDHVAQILKQAGDEFANTQKDLEGHRRTIETIERYRTEANEALQRERDKTKQLQTHLQDQDKFVARFDAAHSELAELRRHNTYLNSQLAETSDALRTVKLEYQSADQSSCELHGRIDVLQKQLSAAERDSDRVRADRESLLASLRGTQEHNRQLTQQLSDQEQHAQALREEIESLQTTQAQWEARAALHQEAAAEIANARQQADPDATHRIEELEGTVAILREQLRMAQIQAQETVQRQLHSATDAGLQNGDASIRQLQQKLDEQSATISQLERDRHALLSRIQKQNRVFSGQDEAA